MKKIVAILTIVLFAICTFTACKTSTKGDIVLPSANDIKQVKITNGDTSTTSDDATYISKLLKKMGEAKDTGKQSVNDAPSGDTSQRIDFNLKNDTTSTVFMYFVGGKLFLEQPYQGIYSVDRSLAKIVSEIK